eukprot:scaffold34666_cov158-Amphora_coffeaeformis.AAC.1
MNGQKDLLRALMDLLDGIVEVFLTSILEPLLLEVHSKLDHAVDQVLRKTLESQKEKIPKWVLKEGVVTYGRMSLALPTVVLLSWGHAVLPAVLHIATKETTVITPTARKKVSGIDFVITSPGQSNVVTDEVVNANRVLILGEHGHLRRVQAKPAVHKD